MDTCEFSAGGKSVMDQPPSRRVEIFIVTGKALEI